MLVRHHLTVSYAVRRRHHPVSNVQPIQAVASFSSEGIYLSFVEEKSVAVLKRYKYKIVMGQFWEGLKGIPKKLGQHMLIGVGMIITCSAVYALVCVLYRLLYDLVLFLLGYASLKDVFVPLLEGLVVFTFFAVPAGLFLVFIGLPLNGLPFYLTERLRIGKYIPPYIGLLILGAVAGLIGAVAGDFVVRWTSVLLLTLYPEIFSSVSPIEPLITENGVPQSILRWPVIAGIGIGALGGLVFWYQRREVILRTKKTTADKRNCQTTAARR